MMKIDPLAFLDESTDDSKSMGSESDLLSFLDDLTQPSPNITKGDFSSKENESDSLAFLEQPKEGFFDKFIPKPYSSEKTSPEKSLRHNVLDTYQPEEKTPEELKAMTVQERMEYAQDLQNLRELQSGTGIAKGTLSGLTFGASEYIPGLKPDENDLMVGLGETLGSYLPITGIYKLIGQPIVSFAAKSPIFRQGLEALARMTGFGITGATYKAGKAVVQGEVPTPAELGKEAATWAGIDAVLQAMGLGVAFQQSVSRIAEQEGVTAKEVLGKLWDATKRKIKKPILPDEITQDEVKALVEEAINAEKQGLSKKTEIEIAPKEEVSKQSTIEKPKHELTILENAVLTKPEHISIGVRGGKGVATVPVSKIGEEDKEYFSHEEVPVTKEERELIDASNAWSTAGDEKESSELADQARKMIFNRLKGQKQPEVFKEEVASNERTFTTSKGSVYEINEDGSTTRNKAVRVEHLGEEGLQPKSEKTWYVTPEDSVKLGEFQTKGEDKKIIELPNGQLGVQYLSGKDKGKIEQRTLVDFSKQPEKDLIPVESWDEGKKIHFGNQIIKIENPKQQQTKSAQEEFPKNEPQYTESGIQKYFPAGTVGDYIMNPEVRNALKDVLDYPVRFAHKDLVPGGLYFKGTPITISKDYDHPEGDYRATEAVLHEAIHALQDRKGRLPIKFTYAENVPYEERPEEISAKKFTDWAVTKERDYSETAEKNKRLAEYEKLDREAATEEHLASKITSKKPTQVPPKQTKPRQPSLMGKKQAVARSKIIKLFRTAFTDPIRLGKIKQRNTAGIHKLWPKVTRLLKDNNVETAAHEIGHNLHTTLYGGDAKTPQEQVHKINTALKPYLDELKPLAQYEPWGMEGFAEFTRLYVTNPDVALELAPKFYAKFESDLEAQYPEMKNALLEARQYYEDYLQGTPQSRIRAQTSYGEDRGKLANIIDGVKKYLNPDFLKTQFLDDVFPAKRLVAEAFGTPLSEVENLKDEQNLYRALRVLKGAVGKGDVFVLHETFNSKTLDKINGSLRDILKQLPNEEAYREFNDYLIARRALEKTAQDIETGINAGDALAVELELRTKYGRLAQDLDKYNDSLLKYAKDAGLLSDKQYAMIKNNNVLYTPFQRVMETEKGGAASGAGRLQAGKPIKRMKGSTRNIIAPIESILKNTYSIIINAEKNLAGQVLAKIAKTKKDIGAYVEHVPTPIKLKGKIEGEQVAKELAKRFEREGLSDLIEYDQDGKLVLREDIADAIPEVFLRFGAGQYPAGENIVTVFFDGKPAYYEVSPELFEMWQKGIAPYIAGLITKILRIPARTLRAGAILNPKFMLKNVVRDTWGSWLFTKYGKSIKDPVGLFIDTLYSPLSMFATAAGKGGLYVEWLKSGGGMSTMQSLDRDTVTKKLEEVRKGYRSYGVIKWLRQTAEVSEEMNRLSEFGKALDVEGKTRLGREIAAFAARDLSIDFAKIGLQTKVLNQIIPFWNATVQGGDKLLRTLANPKDRKNFLPRILGLIVLPSLILAWLNKDDERVKEFYEEEKDFNFITFVGDEAIKIPVPFETGVLAHGLTQRMFNHFMKKDPEAFEHFMGSILSAMSPNFIPAFANPFIETWANKNFFTNARIIPFGKEALISKYQYKNNTSSTARLLGRAMTYMLGQETRSKAASPAIIDHFINSWGGGLGRLMINISDASLEAAGLSDKIPGPQQAITEKLGLDAFNLRYPRASTRSIEKFYDNYADATARKKSLKYAEKMELETEESQQAAYKSFEKIYDYKTLQHAYKAIQNAQREINNIWNDSSITPELKKEMMDDLYLQMIDFAKAANEDIRQYRLSQP